VGKIFENKVMKKSLIETMRVDGREEQANFRFSPKDSQAVGRLLAAWRRSSFSE